MIDRVVLADVIYQLHKKEPFYRDSAFWSEPFANFSASTEETIEEKAPKFVKDLKKQQILREDVSDLICILGDWANVKTCEGIIFTSKAIYVNSPKNNPKKFRVRYDDITNMELSKSSNTLQITDYDNSIHSINTPLWNAYTIKLYLEFASERYKYSVDEFKIIKKIKLPHVDNKLLTSAVSGIIYGNVSNAATIYGEEKFHAACGHGFAAERANTLFDKATGHDAKVIGDDNAKNGADRMVDGIQIQSKYCKTGGKCISECFEDGKFRYWNSNGTPMQIEVPSDMYDSAVQSMKSRISKGEVPGVSDPEEANNIVRKGKFTYEQVKNIAKAGTVDSLTYDAANGMVIATSTFGVTALLSFATAVWDGQDIEFALKEAAINGLKVGGVSFVTAVLAGQLTKAGLNSMLVGSSEAVIKVIGPKGSAVLANAFRQGNNIYGAVAMKSAAKMFRTNAITGIASVVILSTADVVNIFRGRISGEQLLKNVVSTTASVAGGTAGWVGGAAAGASVGSVIPGIGTVAGGLVGGFLGAIGGGAVASDVSDGILNSFIEDDADEMVKIIENEFVTIVENYLLTQKEIEHVIDHMGESINGNNLKEMYASNDRPLFAQTIIMPYIDKELSRRKKVCIVTQKDMQYGLKLALEEIADENY